MVKSTGRNVGNVNMHGKRTLMLSCRCCDCIDLRGKFRTIEDVREMRSAVTQTEEPTASTGE